MNQMNSGDGQWFPQLPEGYVPQQVDWQMDSMTARNQWNQPGWGDWQQPGWHGSQQNWPWGGWPGQQPGHPSYPGGWPGTPSYPGGRPDQPSRPGGGQSQGAPQSAPPSQTPAYPDQQLMRVDPGGIRNCMYRYTYIWTSRRRGFWFYPTFVGRTSIAGYRWNSQWRRWEYTGFDLDRIDTFTCM
ncbi:hypothetical protein [Sporosarcina koreensis]|uniref:hypothetical protein n=1 Tax=Sporosarcina koreensis TaxID=334735 RepID=UPI000A9ABD80|nr:hypothetical protein [Sporosarcina koreensis]